MHTQSFDIRDALAGGRLTKLSRQIVEADLVNAVNGGAFDVALVPNMSAHALAAGPPRNFLPTGAVIADVMIKLDTQFVGGGATSVGVTVGTAAAPTLIATNFDVLGSAASGLYVSMARGAQRVVPTGGELVIARFTPDAGHNLAALTAGQCSIDVIFVPAPRP